MTTERDIRPQTLDEPIHKENNVAHETPIEENPAESRFEKWKPAVIKAAKVAAVGAAVAFVGYEVYKRTKGKDAKVGDAITKVIKTAAEVASKTQEVDKKSKKQSGAKELRKSLRNAAIVGGGHGLVDVAGITIDLHRHKTHRSLTPHPFVTRFVEYSHRMMGIPDTKNWADVHLDHHRFPDVSVFPFVKISRAVNWVEEQRREGKTVDVTVPDSFKHLDPLVKDGEYPRDRLMQTGNFGEAHVKEKLGELYKPPETYTAEELEKIFNPEGPDYHYPKYKKKRKGDYSSDDIATIVLRDPHSPAYARARNGVKEIFETGTVPYLAASDLRKAYPDIRDPHLRNPEGEKPKRVWPAVTASLVVPTLGALAARGEYRKPEDYALAVAGGVTEVVAKFATELGGSMTVNSLGHAGGELTTERIVQAVTLKGFDMRLNPDGTLAADTTTAGPAGRAFSFFTMDEVGRQQFHHDNPGKIRYTEKKGKEGVLDAAWGSLLDRVARSRWSILQPGDNFGLPKGALRPDEPHPATQLIQDFRRLEYNRQHGITDDNKEFVIKT